MILAHFSFDMLGSKSVFGSGLRAFYLVTTGSQPHDHLICYTTGAVSETCLENDSAHRPELSIDRLRPAHLRLRLQDIREVVRVLIAKERLLPSTL